MGLYFSLKFFYFHAATVGVSPEVSARETGSVGAGLCRRGAISTTTSVQRGKR